jgi:hypothetical protein
LAEKRSKQLMSLKDINSCFKAASRLLDTADDKKYIHPDEPAGNKTKTGVKKYYG